MNGQIIWTEPPGWVDLSCAERLAIIEKETFDRRRELLDLEHEVRAARDQIADFEDQIHDCEVAIADLTPTLDRLNLQRLHLRRLLGLDPVPGQLKLFETVRR